MGYWKNLGIAVDQFWNAVFGGDPDETISSRLGKAAQTGSFRAKVACWLIGRVFFQDTSHCKDSIEEDEG